MASMRGVLSEDRSVAAVVPWDVQLAGEPVRPRPEQERVDAGVGARTDRMPAVDLGL